MDAYRDQYATLFNNGDGVKLFGISVDPDTAQFTWARDQGYPVTFLSDVGAEVGKKYGVAIQTRIGLLDHRTVYVIDGNGKIAHVMSPFRETDPTAYAELGAAIAKTRPAH